MVTLVDDAEHGTSFSRSLSKHRTDAVVDEIGLTMRPGAVDVELVLVSGLVVVVVDVDAIVDDEFEIAVEDATDGGADGSTTTAQLVTAIIPDIVVLFAAMLGIAYRYSLDFPGTSVKVSYCTEVVVVVVWEL